MITGPAVFRALPGVDYRVISPHHRVEPIVLIRAGTEARVNLPQSYCVHSPAGFDWGYYGSGPADLALNILALVVEPPEAYRLHQDYKREVIARLPVYGGTILMEEVVAWVVETWAEARRYEDDLPW